MNYIIEKILAFVACILLLASCNEKLPKATYNLYEINGVTSQSGDGSVTLQWTNQTDKSLPNEWYITWTASLSGVAGGETSVPSTTTSIKIDNLVNGCPYTFSVQGRYNDGLSRKLSSSCTPKSTRIAPSAFKAIAGNGRVFLTWVAPSTSLEYNYNLSSLSSEGNKTYSVSKGSSSFLVEGLTNGVEYTFTLFCTYGHGNSDSVTSSATPGQIDPIFFSSNEPFIFELTTMSYNQAFFVKGTISSVSWDFGDGEKSSQTSPIHCFTKSGKITVSVTVNYADGSSETATADINVKGFAWTSIANVGYQKSSNMAFSPDGQTLYSVSQSTKALIAINAISGEIKWTYSTASATYGAGLAIGSDGTVYFGTEDTNGSLLAVSASGVLRWSKELGSAIKASPAITSDGKVYALNNNGKLYCLNAESGGEIWTAEQTGTASGVVVGSDGTVYFATSGGIWAYNDVGNIIWVCPTAFNVTERGGSLAIYDGILYAVLKSKGGCAAINSSTGVVLWQYPTSYGDCYHPVVDSEGTVYFCEKAGGVYAVKKNGTLKWNDLANLNYIYSGFAIDAEGTAYISQYATPFRLMAYNASGSANTVTEIGSQTMSPITIGPDNRIYYACNGTINATNIGVSIAKKGWPCKGGNMQGSNSLK